MGFISQAGHVGMRLQGFSGTYASPGEPGALDALFFRIRAGGITGNRELLIPDPEIGGSRDVPDAQLGPIVFLGSYDFYAKPRVLQLALAATLGEWDSVTDGDLQEITIQSGDDCPWLSIEEKIANGYETFGYMDCKVDTLTLDADADGFVTGKMDMLGRRQHIETPTAVVDQTPDVFSTYTGVNSVITLNGVDLRPKTVSLEINNNIEDDDFRLGSLFVKDLDERRREVTMTVTVRPEDSVLWRTAMWGNPSAGGPGFYRPTLLPDLKWSMTSSETFTSGATTSPYLVEINLNKVIAEPFNASPAGDDVLEDTIIFRLFRPDPMAAGLTAFCVDHPLYHVVRDSRPYGEILGSGFTTLFLTEDGLSLVGA